MITASADSATGPAAAAANELTWEGWIGDPDAFGDIWWQVTPAAAETCDYFAVAAHSLGSTAIEVEIQRWDGAAWVTIVRHAPLDDAPFLVSFTAASAADWRLQFFATPSTPAGLTDAQKFVGVIFIGSRLDMPTSIYGGHSPAALSADAIIEPHYSERGEFLGRSVIRTGETGTYEWKHLDPAWYRANFAPFVRYAMEGRGAFFIKWRPGKYDETIYGWSEGRIRPSNMGIGPGLMEVSVNVRGLAQPGMRY